MHRYSPGKDGNHRRGGEGSSTPPKKGEAGHQNTPSFLGSTLWDKTIPYDPDLKVTLEHMELEDFMSENDVISSLDEQSVQKSLDFLSRCGTDTTSSPPQQQAKTTSSTANNKRPSACSSAYSSPLHTPPNCSPAYNVPSNCLTNPGESTNFNFPPYSSNMNSSSAMNPFLSTLANSSSSSPYHSPGSSGHLTDLSNAPPPNSGTPFSTILKEPSPFYRHPTDSSSRLSDSSSSNDQPDTTGLQSSSTLTIDACSDILFADTDLINNKPGGVGDSNTVRKRENLQAVCSNLNQNSSYDSNMKDDRGRPPTHVSQGKKISSCGKRWASFSSDARESLKGRPSTAAYNTTQSATSIAVASAASSIFEIPSAPEQSVVTPPPVKKRAYNKKNKLGNQAGSVDLKPKVECLYTSPSSNDNACSSGGPRPGGKNLQQFHEALDDSSTGSIDSRGPPSKARSPYGMGKRQAAAVAAIAFAPDTPSPPHSLGCSSPTSSRSSCYSPQPDHEDDDPIDPSEMASFPGRGSFNPRTRRFTGDELKPQPMVKKSRKQYVPPDLKDDKYWARRRKNNVAAKRSRDARRIKENQIALRATYLEDTHQKMAQDLEAAKTTIELLKKRLAKYEAV